MRLHELAKDMEADSKELLALAKKLGLPIKSHSSNLAPGEVALLRVGYRYRDLDEDELFDRLESDAEERQAEKKAEEEAKKEEQVRRRAEREARSAEEPEEVPEEASVEAVAATTASTDGAAVETAPEPEVVAEPEVAEVAASTEPAALSSEPSSEEVAEEQPPTVATEPAEEQTVAASTEAAETTETTEEKPAAEQKPGQEDGRRGAKILGRIELDNAEVAKSQATHEQLERSISPSTGGPGRRGGKEDDKTTAQTRRRKSAKQVKWAPDPEDFAPVSANEVAKPRFWERGPARRQGRRAPRRGPKVPKKKPVAPDRKVTVVAPLTVKDFSQATGIRAAEILGKLLMSQGTPSTINSMLDEELVLTLALEFGREIEVRSARDVEAEFLAKEEGPEETSEEERDPDLRPPVVTFMGHVDHGKTSLLDFIRKSKVVDGEAGGITQHVSAYQVQTPAGGKVTFLDTPGHRAFTEMRARGADCTDIVVLIVAADDGVMPQTEEALHHARAAGEDRPLVVALNKIDRPESDALRVKQQLMAADVLPEEFGGKIAVIETSAMTGQGVDELLERLALEAEIHDLRADNSKKAKAYVLEASKQEGKGVVATVLVRDGTLKVRDPFLCGKTWGRVRLLEDDQGRRIKEAGPSTPVRVYGFKGEIPEAGDLLQAVEDERGAEKVANERNRKDKETEDAPREAVTLENLFESLEAGKVHEINVVVKADVQGSVEVLKRELTSLRHEEVAVKVLRAAVGGITEEDIMLASTTQAICIGFGVAPDGKARRAAERLGVEIRTYRVIYEIFDDLKKAMAGSLSPEQSERIVGHVEIREVFKVSRVGSIAGCYVLDGMIRRSDQVRVVREGKVLYTSGLDSLRRFKEDAKEVKEGFECGIKVTGFDDIKVGDQLEAFEIVFEQRELTLP